MEITFQKSYITIDFEHYREKNRINGSKNS